MAACKFSIPFSGDASGILERAKSAVEKQNGNFTGDTSAGNFDVTVFGNTVKGSYTLAGQSLEIVIDSKPFLIPCGTIESFLKSQIK